MSKVAESNCHVDIHDEKNVLVTLIPSQYLPDKYFHLRDLRTKAKAPPVTLLWSFIGEVIACVGAFAALLFYFATVTTTVTVVSNSLKEGYTCEILAPKAGAQFISKSSSENIQFSSATADYTTCMASLEASNVCQLGTVPYIATVSPRNTNTACTTMFADGTMFCKADIRSINVVTPDRSAVSYGKSTSTSRPPAPGTGENYTDIALYDYYFIGSQGILNYKVGPTEIFVPLLQRSTVGATSTLAWKDYIVFTDTNLQNSAGVSNIYGLNKTDLSKRLLFSAAQFPAIPESQNVLQTLYANGNTLCPNNVLYVVVDNAVTSILFSLDLNTFDISFTTLASKLSASQMSCGHDGLLYYNSYSIYGFGIGLYSLEPGTQKNATYNASWAVAMGLSDMAFSVIDSQHAMFTDFDSNVYFANLESGENVHVATANENINGYSANFINQQSTFNFYLWSPSGRIFAIDQVAQTLSLVLYPTSTHYMVMYTYGVCNGAFESDFIEVSNSLDFSVVCPHPNGYYYQSPNIWVPTPAECSAMQPTELLSSCENVASSMHELVAFTCSASFDKICKASFDDNPPFSCSKQQTSPLLTVISLAYSNTLAVYGALSFVIATLFAFVFTSRNYRNSIANEEALDKAREPYKKEDEVCKYHLASFEPYVPQKV